MMMRNELTAAERLELKQSESCYMVGVLADKERYYPTSGDDQECITAQKNNISTIIFYIKPLNTEPKPIIRLIDNPHKDSIDYSPLYIGMDRYRNQSFFGAQYRYTNDFEHKKQLIDEKLRGKLIIFKPVITILNGQYGELIYKNLDIINIESDINVTGNERYIPIPKTNIKNTELEKKFRNGTDIYFEDYTHMMDAPEHIVCGEYIYFNLKQGWEQNEKNTTMWSYKGDFSDIKKVKLNMDTVDSPNSIVFGGSDNILFIEENFLMQNIDKQIGTAESILGQVPVDIAEDIKSDLENAVVVKEEGTIDLSEYHFLASLKEFTISQGLSYDMDDLINFHICVKTNPLTIVAGMSGTGKTQLARAYAKMLELSEANDTLLFLPISPSFTEPGDLLGYLNNTNGLFIPSETGLTDLLIHAMNNPNKMHMVIFDEMNLSQVEHWFAPFISLLELEPSLRKLSLYNEKAHCINSERYKPTVTIGSNIIFIGTVNIDETTKDFSDRLMDRANFITLKKGSFLILYSEQKDKMRRDNDFQKHYCHSHADYNAWVNTDDPMSVFNTHELEFFDELHDKIYKADNQKGVSFRIVEKIALYLKNIPKGVNDEDMIDRRYAFDLQIKQRLLTKIRGTENQCGALLGLLNNNDLSPRNSILYNLFDSDDAQKISDFRSTKDEICKKARELSVYGYAN